VASRPLVADGVAALARAGLLTGGEVLRTYDAETEEALTRVAGRLYAEGAAQVASQAEIAGAAAARQWARYRGNHQGATRPATREKPSPPDPGGNRDGGPIVYAPRAPGPGGVNVILQAGEEDPERGDRGDQEVGNPRLQRSLQALHERALRADIVQRAQEEGRWVDATRLQELGDSSVSLEWFWVLNHFHGPTLTPARYADAVRLLLGVAAPAHPMECRICGHAVEPGDTHGLHCPRREITVRHNALRDAWAPLIAAVDPNLMIKADGLLP
jgi:hypothetical protein